MAKRKSKNFEETGRKGRAFGKKNQGRLNQTIKGQNRFKLKRKNQSEFKVYSGNNNNFRYNNSRPTNSKGQQQGKRAGLTSNTRKQFVKEKITYSKYSKLKKTQEVGNRVQKTKMISQSRRQQSGPARGLQTKGNLAEGEGLKLFTKSFDARKKIDAKRQREQKKDVPSVKTNTKALLDKSREQKRESNVAQRREMSLMGDKIQIISRIPAEEERKALFTGSSLKVTTLQTASERQKHRETSEIGSSILITTKNKRNQTAEEVQEMSEYKLFEAKRKAQQHERVPAVEVELPKLSSLHPISRPKRAVPVYEVEEETLTTNRNSSKILITNLHPNVTSDDIYELFSAVAPLKNARMVRNGIAEITYHSHEEAAMAHKRYHGRNLDGQPMICKIASAEQPIYSPPSSRLQQQESRSHQSSKSSSTSSARPVVFTVKI